MKTRVNSDSGITFIELIVVVVIIGLVSAMAVPRFQIAWERIKIKGVDRDIVSTLRLARSMAITDKDQYGVYFDNNNQTITIFKDLVNPNSPQFESGDSVIRIDTLPAEFTYLGTDITNDVVVFRPNGSANFVGGGNISSLAVTESVVGILLHNVLASTGRIRSVSCYY